MHRPGLVMLWLNRQTRGVLVIATKAEDSVTPEVNALISGDDNKITALGGAVCCGSGHGPNMFLIHWDSLVTQACADGLRL